MNWKRNLFYFIALFSISPYINAIGALLLGTISGYILEGNYDQKKNDKWAKQLLKIAIVGLGFTLTFSDIIKVSSQSVGITLMSIILIFTLGYILSKQMRLSPKMCFLIASGTAICGGSAIAAVAPVVRAKSRDISNALISIFLLNAVALFIFPLIGKLFHLSDFEFGLWSAIAIHDTSSVAGASASFSDSAFQVATITKLARTIWIIPLVIVASYFFGSKEKKTSLPWFIVLFVLASVISTFFLDANVRYYFKIASKETLDLALFFIGTSLKYSKIQNFFTKSFLLALILWLVVSVVMFVVIVYYF